MRNIFIAALLVLLVSCGAKQETPGTTQENKGIAVGSITFTANAPHNDIYRFFYAPVSGDKKFVRANSGKIEIKARENNQRAYTGDTNNKKTYLFVIEGAPGNYALNQYSYLDHIGYSGMVSSSKKFAIPFELKKDGVIYIGELNYNDDATPGTPRIKMVDNFDRDIAAAKSKFPTVKMDRAENKTVTSGDSGKGIVEF